MWHPQTNLRLRNCPLNTLFSQHEEQGLWRALWLVASASFKGLPWQKLEIQSAISISFNFFLCFVIRAQSVISRFHSQTFILILKLFTFYLYIWWINTHWGSECFIHRSKSKTTWLAHKCKRDIKVMFRGRKPGYLCILVGKKYLQDLITPTLLFNQKPIFSVFSLWLSMRQGQEQIGWSSCPSQTLCCGLTWQAAEHHTALH